MYVLRPYQEEAVNSVALALASAKSTLIEMATGLGKTVILGHVADQWPGRVLVIAHRDELIRQAAEKIQEITGHPVAVEMGRERAEDNLYGTKTRFSGAFRDAPTVEKAKGGLPYHPVRRNASARPKSHLCHWLRSTARQCQASGGG